MYLEGSGGACRGCSYLGLGWRILRWSLNAWILTFGNLGMNRGWGCGGSRHLDPGLVGWFFEGYGLGMTRLGMIFSYI